MSGGSARPFTRAARRFLAGLLVVVALGACGSDEEPELTFEDLLNELEGRELTPVEVARRAEIGETLCQLDDQLLDEIWQRLDDQQLDFQDIVISSLCPERAILYAGHTGRRVTEEAVQSGVRTSTTRPTTTTTTTIRTPTTRATAGPTPTSESSSTDSTGSGSTDSPSSSSTVAGTGTSTSTTRASTPPSSGTTSIVTTTSS